LKNLVTAAKARLCFLLMQKPIPYLKFGKFEAQMQQAQLMFNQIVYQRHHLQFDKQRCVVYEFNPNGYRKALVVHGWMSRSAHMVMHIQLLIEQGYHVYAIDLPAHGESKGQLLSWRNAVKALLQAQVTFGPFAVALGHSFGGGMLVNATAISHLMDDIDGVFHADKMVLLASALSIQVPITMFSKLARLNEVQTRRFSELIAQDAQLELAQMSGLSLQTHYPSQTDFLLIHGVQDGVVSIEESRAFAMLGPQVKLVEIEQLNHVGVLYQQQVFDQITRFLTDSTRHCP